MNESDISAEIIRVFVYDRSVYDGGGDLDGDGHYERSAGSMTGVWHEI